MSYFNFFACVFYFIGCCVQSSYAKADRGIATEDLRKLPTQLPGYSFNPNDFQRLKGERRHEEYALRYLKRLDERSKQLPNSEAAFADPEFLKLRDQLADCFLTLFSYAAHLPNSDHLSLGQRITHVNSLQEVIEHPLFMKAIDGIYGQRPIFKRVAKHLFNEELTRDDFEYNVQIGKNPFFQPLCVLLSYLYNGEDVKSSVNRMLEGTRRILETRYDYFTHLKPLDRVISHINEMLDKTGMENEEVAQGAYVHLLAEEKESSNPDDDDDEYSPKAKSSSAVLPITPEIERYLLNNEQLAGFLRKLKDIIHHDIDNRYGFDDKDPLIEFPPALVSFRRSIPWATLSTLGSAAHYATLYRQHDLQKMFVQAGPDLMADLKTLQRHLKELQSLEHDHFLGKDLEETEIYSYPNIDRFTAWYLNFIGLDMMKSHLREVKHYAGSFDDPEKLFADCCHKWQIPHLASKVPFLQSKSRLFPLSHFFDDGELSKYFVKTLKGKADKTWISLFDAFKTLRDDIMHKTQEEGQEEFEKRLNALKDQTWTQIVESYCSVFDAVAALRQAFDRLGWEDLKQDWKGVLPDLDVEKARPLRALEDNLRHLSIFITTGSWETPEDEFKRKAEAFQVQLREQYPDKKHYKQFSPGTLLQQSEKGWDRILHQFGEAVSHETKEQWRNMKENAKNIKESKALVKRPKAPKTSSQRLTENLQSFRWALSQLDKAYDKGGLSRLSSIPESRIAGLYLVLMRESANNLLCDLPEHLVFDSDDRETTEFFQASIYLFAVLPQLVSGFGNNKAHIHRLTEASAYEIPHQSVGSMLASHFDALFASIETIDRFLATPLRLLRKGRLVELPLQLCTAAAVSAPSKESSPPARRHTSCLLPYSECPPILQRSALLPNPAPPSAVISLLEEKQEGKKGGSKQLPPRPHKSKRPLNHNVHNTIWYNNHPPRKKIFHHIRNSR